MEKESFMKNAAPLLFRVLAVGWPVLMCITLAGCAPVGPDYEAPPPNAPEKWHTALRQGLVPDPTDSQQLAAWWSTLEDPVLTHLIGQAASSNLDLRQAVARIREARARRGISGAARFPSLDASGSARRSKSSDNSGSGATRSFYALGFDAGWEVDIFGGVRRSFEAAGAELDASRENLYAVLVSLTAEVGVNYLDLRILQARLLSAEKNLAIQQETFELIRSQYRAGLSSELAFQQARSNLESTAAQLPALRGSLEQSKNLLALLTGKVPGAVHALVAEPRPIPVAPVTVAVGVPAEALRRRPDVRRAERNLAAQAARVGVATADLYPKFRLAGSIGLEALNSGDLFTSGAGAWSIGPGISWNIFNAGGIRRNIEAQTAVQEQALLSYEAAVLNALAEAENGFSAYAEEQLRRGHLLAATDAARQAEKLARDQYAAGLTDFTTVLEAQRFLLSLEDQLVQSSGAVTANLIRLYKALGGGWSSTAADELLTEDENQ